MRKLKSVDYPVNEKSVIKYEIEKRVLSPKVWVYNIGIYKIWVLSPKVWVYNNWY